MVFLLNNANARAELQDNTRAHTIAWASLFSPSPGPSPSLIIKNHPSGKENDLLIQDRAERT